MGEVVPARTSPTLHPPSLCVIILFKMCPSASTAVTSTLREEIEPNYGKNTYSSVRCVQSSHASSSILSTLFCDRELKHDNSAHFYTATFHWDELQC